MKKIFAFLVLFFLANFILESINFFFVHGFSYLDFFLASVVFLLFFSVLFYYLSLVNNDRKKAYNHYEDIE